MAFITENVWLPLGVESLEESAEQVVRSKTNTLVVAGPGSGKTELLAQRACFLLQTGNCRSPKRILAISYKRDAKKNIADRVKMRIGDPAARFDSFTMDAFAKGLIDRFRQAIPKQWRPKQNYQVRLSQLNKDAMKNWFINTNISINKPDFNQWQDRQIEDLFNKCAHGYSLPLESDDIPELDKHFGLKWWRQVLAAPENKPSLSFPMISRLAAFMLSKNPKLLKALRQTYTHVFMDEFQDTTSPQYDLICACFEKSKSIVTAVGDSKQRIMGYAGALDEIFEKYKNDYEAQAYELVNNYRSAPYLVKMQDSIANALDPSSKPAKAVKDDEIQGVCLVLEFGSQEQEAQILSDCIQWLIQENELKPRDICILVRQSTGQMIQYVQKELKNNRNIKLRDESQLQDLLTEPLAQIILAILRLSTKKKDPDAWENLLSFSEIIYGWDYDQEDSQLANKEAERLVKVSREAMRNVDGIDKEKIESLLKTLLGEIGEARLRANFEQYTRGDFLIKTIESLSSEISKNVKESGNICAAIDDLVGLDTIPAMTIHKSKGLEFNTIIFMGLEDSSWWGFANQPEEEKRTFFVAFSRAIQRVYFTFSDQREERFGRKKQNRNNIGDLYEILSKAGVETKDLRTL